MLFGRRIAVVVPARNEERLLPRTLRSVPPFVDDVVVVDDASEDATSAAALGVGDARVRVVRQQVRTGVGGAIARGYTHAFAGGADVAAVMAGDAQMDPADLARVIEPVACDEADYVKGDRLSHPTAWRAMPLRRRIPNEVLSAMTRVATGLSIRDSQCGYTALSRVAAERIRIEAMWRGYGYPNDLLGRLARAGLRVREVVVRPIYADERSDIRWVDGLVVVPFVIAKSALARLRDEAAAV